MNRGKRLATDDFGRNPSGRGNVGALRRRPRLPYSRYGCASPPCIASRIALVAHVFDYEIGSSRITLGQPEADNLTLSVFLAIMRIGS